MMRRKILSFLPFSRRLTPLALIAIAACALCAHAQDDKGAIRAILDKNGMKDKTVNEVAEFNSAGRAIVLNLNKRGIDGVALSAFPPEIFGLTALKGLLLKGNDLKGLPSEIGNLTGLIELNLADNTDLGSLPPAIGNLVNLQTLDIRYCNLTDLPHEFGNLRSLESLQMWGNGFTELPYCITELSNLKEIYLKNNKLAMLPKDIIKMDKLRYVDVQLNYLCNLLPEVEKWLQARDKRYKEHQHCGGR